MLASAPRVLNGQYEHFSIGYALLLMTQQEMDASVEEKRIECRTRVYQHTSLSCLHEVRRSQMRNAHIARIATRAECSECVRPASSSPMSRADVSIFQSATSYLMTQEAREISNRPRLCNSYETTKRLKPVRPLRRYDPTSSSRKASSTILRSHT